MSSSISSGGTANKLEFENSVAADILECNVCSKFVSNRSSNDDQNSDECPNPQSDDKNSILEEGSHCSHNNASRANDSREQVDEDDATISSSRPFLVRISWISIGFISLAVGAAGIVLPGLPTTPFVLVAAFCFARSSDKFLQWLLNSRLFGPTIRQWRENRSLPSKGVKMVALFVVTICFTASITFTAIFSSVWWLAIVLGVLFVGLSVFIVTLPVASIT